MTRKPLHTLQADLATEGLVASDGTIWSHACTIGQYNKGEAFTLDQAAITNFVRVFRAGYPSKVPVDYEHASTSSDPEIRKLRGQGEIPKAGDVLELRGVFAVADFTGDLLASAEKLAAKAARPLDDPRNLGLWMRWKPTAKALTKIQAGEFSELSISWVDDLEDKSSGKGQGPAILAVALTLLPFLDEMLPVAASRGGRRDGEAQQDLAVGGSTATDAREEQMTTRTLTMFAAVAALAAKPVTDEEQAITELTALQPDISRLRKLGSIVAERFGGETDPDKIGAKILDLSAAVTRHEAAAKAAREASIKTSVEAALKTHEKKLTVPTRAIFARELTRELSVENPPKVEETEAFKALASMSELGITTRASGADDGTNANSTDPDAQLDRVARELLETDPALKALSATEPGKAYDQAVDKAAKKIKYQSPQMLRIAEGMEPVSA